MRTGIIQPLPGIGDMIWHVPAVRAIAEASAGGRVTLISKPSAQADRLFAGEEIVSEVLSLPTGYRGAKGAGLLWFKVWRTLRQAHLSRLIILHQSPRYQWVAQLARIPEIITYPPDLAESKASGWDKSLALLQRLKIPVDEPRSRLSVDPKTVEAMRQRFAAFPTPWLMIAPGATAEARRWPLDRFAICADALVEATGGTVFIIGGSNEGDSISELYRHCLKKSSIRPLIQLRLDQAMALMTCCELLLGNDSGPANVAAAVGCPAYALCGVSEPARHSDHLHLIVPDLRDDLQEDFGTGMEAITTRHTLNTLKRGLPHLFSSSAAFRGIS